MWEFTNNHVKVWMASNFTRALYQSKRYRRLVSEMQDALEAISDQTGQGTGIDIVYYRDRFFVTMTPGASLRFSLPIAHMFGFLDANFALRSPYKDGRFQIQHGVQRMSLVWVEQPTLSLRFEICPPQGTSNYNPPPFPRLNTFTIVTNLQIEPLFDGNKKSRDLRKLVVVKGRVQETFQNVHFFNLEQQRIKQIEMVLKVDTEREMLFRSGSVVVTLQFRNRSRR